MEKLQLTKECLSKKAHADVVLNLWNFLVVYNIRASDLQDKVVATAMLNATAKNSGASASDLVRTVLSFGFEDPKDLRLYRVNRGVLLVACVEHVLLPDTIKNIYRTIYNCDYPQALRMYNLLKGQDEDIPPGKVAAQRILPFFHCDKFLKDRVCLQRIRLYLRSITIDAKEMDFIRSEVIRLIESCDGDLSE
ncbi:uncharacterized protein LOC106659652 [Trichogramma pretiosum]|uniref:uncharacterized protein LOC106659652 n=1 Tax=Trichogramma pretiosum TaxID=7493 RepID=UPI0006C9C12F|nr:uncharacterized protein LOC106659652 [Trichogramma pretiosum]